MFVHSLWSHTSAEYDSVLEGLREVFGDLEQLTDDGAGRFFLTRTSVVEGQRSDAWISPEATAASYHLTVHVLESERLNAPHGTIVGTVSHLPALNSDVMDDLRDVLGAEPVFPDLTPGRVANLQVYEARIVTDDGERSITYSDPHHAAALFRQDWSGAPSLTAATIRHEELGALVTAFADGQVWLEGTEPTLVPEVLAGTVGRLWFGR